MLHIVTDAYTAFFMCGACGTAGPPHTHASVWAEPVTEAEMAAAGLAVVDAAEHVLSCSLLQEVTDG